MRIVLSFLLLLCMAGCTMRDNWSGSSTENEDGKTSSISATYGDPDDHDPSAVRRQIDKDNRDAIDAIDPNMHMERGQ